MGIRLRGLGYEVDSCLVDLGDTAEAVAARHLNSRKFDCVMIGAGLRAPPQLLLFEKLINLVHAQVGGGADLRARGATLDRVDLPQDGQRQDRPDAGGRWQDGQFGGEVLSGGHFDRGLQAAEGGIERLAQGPVGLDAATDEGVGAVGADGSAFRLVLDVVADGRPVGLAAGRLRR